ncbi:MAG TPA: hypothetical protein VK923_04260 [Euzebyales bacterium]|nr:hypothetical protein [Euzebyales bacterium]
MSGTSRNASGREPGQAAEVVVSMLDELSSSRPMIRPRDEGDADEAGRLGEISWWER